MNAHAQNELVNSAVLIQQTKDWLAGSARVSLVLDLTAQTGCIVLEIVYELAMDALAIPVNGNFHLNNIRYYHQH